MEVVKPIILVVVGRWTATIEMTLFISPVSN